MADTKNTHANQVKDAEKISRRNSLEVETPEGSVEEAEINDEDVESQHVTSESRQGLLKILTKAIGLDITAITLPVTLNEPASFLMRLCEQIQYTDLLDKANQCDDSTERLLYVSIFAASLFAVAERTGKPFNPLLGETYEMVSPKRNNLKFIAEQVSHHPPIGSCHAENDNFIFYTSQQLKTKFTGNSLDCISLGSSNVILKKTNEHFQWHGLKTTVHNVIIGKIWLDHHGPMEVRNKTSGDICKMEFTKCGWFSKGFHELNGTVYDANGKATFQLHGKWNEAIYAKELDGASDKKKESKKEKKAVRKQMTENEPLWQHTYKALEPSQLPCKYMVDWTEHSLEVCHFPEEMRKILPPTDSRLRADRYALEKMDIKKAAAEKHNLEEKQRAEARARKNPWQPRYFKKSTEDQNDWLFLNNYWEDREKRVQAANL